MACNMYPNLCPQPGDQSVNLLGKILSVLNAGGGGGGAGVSSLSINGGPAQTGAVSLDVVTGINVNGGGIQTGDVNLTIPSALLNFTDENSDADAVIWGNAGTTELFRAVGATSDLQFGPSNIMTLRGSDGRLTLSGRASFNTISTVGHLLTFTDASNSTSQAALTLTHTLTAPTVGAAGMGVRLDFNLDSDTTPNTRASRWDTAWTVATHATRNSTSTFFNFVAGTETAQLVLGNNQIAGNVGSVGAPSFTGRTDLDTGMWFPAGNTLAWSLGAAEHARLNTSGFGVGVTPLFKLHAGVSGIGSGSSGGCFQQASGNGESFELSYFKSRGTLTAPTIITSGDDLGIIGFSGHTGTTFRRAAAIRGDSTGTIGASQLPGILVFATATNVSPSVLTDALRIDEAQGVTLLAGRLALRIVTLTDAATIATNAAAGNIFRVTLGGNRTLGNPTNPTDGQTARWEFTQDGAGNRTIAFDTQFNFGTDLPTFVLTTTAGARDYIVAIYNQTANVWDVVAGSHDF